VALSANLDRPFKAGANQVISLLVAATTHIYKGAAVMCVAGTGYAVPGADTASGRYMGIALEEADNSAGSAGDIRVKVLHGATHLMTKASAAITDLGYKVALSDDTTVAHVSVTTNDVLMGTVTALQDSTHVWVDDALVGA
jgi:hypothetical protein